MGACSELTPDGSAWRQIYRLPVRVGKTLREAYRLTVKAHVQSKNELSVAGVGWAASAVLITLPLVHPGADNKRLWVLLPMTLPLATRTLTGFGWDNKSVDQRKPGGLAFGFRFITGVGAVAELSMLGLVNVGLNVRGLIRRRPYENVIQRFELRRQAGEK